MPHIENVIKLDSHDERWTYIAWLDSGYTYGTYDFIDDMIPVKPGMLTTALNNASTVTETEVSETPFSTWNFPEKVLRVNIKAHCDLYAMPVTKDVILTAWGDKSLEHSADTPENLRESIQHNPSRSVTQVRPADTPFRRNKSSSRE